ncbi:MAG: lipid-A-disaccharide synthase [Pseudomonadales bacterium]
MLDDSTLTVPSKPLRIGIVVGEASGDILGAGLMIAIKTRCPHAQFEGMGGDRMVALGLKSMFAMDRLAVMGLLEPLKRLPELLRMRRTLKRHFIDNPPDLFLGIDSPDFNLGLELALKRKGILTAHYVSPSVWAWRQGRVKKIRRAVDHMLTLFPFEAAFYRDHDVPVTFVGHPLADQFDLECDVPAAREALGIDPSATVLALMPGSRRAEIEFMAPVYFEAVVHLLQQIEDLQCWLPAANADRLAQLKSMLPEYEARYQSLAGRIHLIEGKSHLVMAAADAVLMTSGTTTLEAMLLKKPMTVAYRMSAFAFSVVKRLVKTPYVALPNLLAGELLVPEFIQDDVEAEAIAAQLYPQLSQGHRRDELVARFVDIHQQIRCDASAKAAETLLQLVADRQK